MKKKILLFVLAFAMLFTSLVSTSYAEEAGDSGSTWQCQCPVHNPDYEKEGSTCEGAARRVNVAKNATFVETSTDGWQLATGLPCLVDGDWHTGALSNPKHAPAANNYFEMHFAEENNITEINFVVNSTGQGSYDANSVWNELTNNDFQLTVKLYNDTEQVGETVTIATKDIQVYTITPNSQITKMTVQSNSAYVTTNVIWEVEVWSQQISHIWELTNTDTASTCTVAGVGDYACACGETNLDAPIPATGHTAGTEWLIQEAVADDPDTEGVDETVEAKHYNACINDNCTEKLNVSDHVWTNDCDVKCDTCGKTREVTGTHTFYADCSTKCENCDHVRTDAIEDHTWDHACDTECNACEEERVTAHVYTDCEDTTCNSGEGTANACGATREAPGHAWDNACDTTCNNECGVTRTTEHQYDSCEATECNECGTTRAALAHAWADCEDTTCDTCGMARTAPGHAWTNACDTTCNNTGCTATRTVDSSAHVYENACDGTCNNEGCTVTRTPADHVYDNTCDTKCNVCEAERTIEHTYDNACDKTCNVCNAERTVADHVDADENELCDICNAEVPKKGLSGGAIAGIVIGSVAVVGGGGFAAWWFIFRKKAV